MLLEPSYGKKNELSGWLFLSHYTGLPGYSGFLKSVSFIENAKYIIWEGSIRLSPKGVQHVSMEKEEF